ncbi:hypothetical protein EDD15DRAFT_2467775 [Pisolithus albus]|nr:hypothetical protein EDD15DRAFT_2467775 [Pisolithus albus]
MPWFACPTAGAGHPRLTDQVNDSCHLTRRDAGIGKRKDLSVPSPSKLAPRPQPIILQVVRNGERKRNAKTHSRRPRLNFEVAADDSQLFYFDAVAVPVPDFINPEYARQPSDAPSEDCSQDEHKLLLPSHVSLLAPSTDGADPIEVIPPPIVNSDDDYIDFSEYEDRSIRSDCRYYLCTNFSQGSRTCVVYWYFEVEADGATQADHPSSSVRIAVQRANTRPSNIQC